MKLLERVAHKNNLSAFSFMFVLFMRLDFFSPMDILLKIIQNPNLTMNKITDHAQRQAGLLPLRLLLWIPQFR